MAAAVWTLAKLTPEQEKLLREGEATLGNGVVLAMRKDQVIPSQLTPSQLQCLQGLEQKLGMVLVAVKPQERVADIGSSPPSR